MRKLLVITLRVLCFVLAGVGAWQAYGLATSSSSQGLLDVGLEENWALETEVTESQSAGQKEASKDAEKDQKEAGKDNGDGATDATKKDGEVSSDKKAEGKKEKKNNTPPPLPKRFEQIAESGILGKVPPKPVQPPALIGVIGDAAILRIDGKEDLVHVGGKIGAATLLKIATNRVLIEYKGKEQELTVYEGLGSDSLIKKKEEKAPSPSPPQKQGDDSSNKAKEAATPPEARKERAP